MSQTISANWKRTSTRLKRNAEELIRYDAEVRLPDNFDTPPPFRNGRTPAIVEVSRTGVGSEQGSAPDRPE